MGALVYHHHCGDYMGQVEWGGKGVQGGILGDMLPGGAIESQI